RSRAGARPGRPVPKPPNGTRAMIAPAARDERGSVAITGLLLAVALLMLLGAAVDVGHAFIVRRDLTSVADDAALAGSQQLDLAAWRQGRLALDPQRAEQAADSALGETSDVSGGAS